VEEVSPVAELKLTAEWIHLKIWICLNQFHVLL